MVCRYLITFWLNFLIDLVKGSANIIRVIKSRRMRWAEHVTFMEEIRGAYRVLAGKPEGKKALGRSDR